MTPTPAYSPPANNNSVFTIYSGGRFRCLSLSATRTDNLEFNTAFCRGQVIR